MVINNKIDIVFFTPSLNRTGSEIVLFNLLPFAKNDFNITVISKYKGEMYNYLPSYMHTEYLYENQKVGLLSKIKNRIRRIFVIPKLLNQYKHANWYINTLILPDILEYAKSNNIPTIVHLHELEQMYFHLSNNQIKTLTDYPFVIVANSKICADTITRFGRKNRITIIYPAIDLSSIHFDDSVYQSHRKSLGIKVDDFVWIMAGTLDINKNPILFIDIACELKKEFSSFKMIWIGSSNGNISFERECIAYAKEKNVTNCIYWLGDKKVEFHNYFSCANGFVLTSEIESFSMVTVEALLLGLPVVSNNCGGVSEIIEGKFGNVISEKNNVHEMVNFMKIIMLNKAPIHKRELIQRGKMFDKEIIGKEWIKFLKKHIK